MSDRPLCSHGDHDDGSKWCDEAREALCNRLQLIRIRLGTDFETHGGKKVMYVGVVGWSWPMVPYGAIGTVESSSDHVMVEWDCISTNGIPKPYYAHSWKELEVLKTDDDGKILPGEIERASLKIAPRVLQLALPCPVCGSKVLSFAYGDQGCSYAFCSVEYRPCGDPRPQPKHCGARGPAISDQFPELMAIAVWNLRGAPKVLTKEIRGFPNGDVEVVPTVAVVDVQDSPCPWCLGTKVRVSRQENIDSWHGHCEGCGGHGPWWPDDYDNRARSVADVVRDWKKRPVKVPS
jgi:hypothetical protein